VTPTPGLAGGTGAGGVVAGEGAVAGGISTGAVAAAGVAAIVVVCVIAGIQLWRMMKFQEELEAQGFVILDDPLAVCIRNCHTGPVKLPTFREFPDLPAPDFPTRLSPRDVDLLRRWLDEKPTPGRGKEQKTEPKPEPKPQPRYRPGDPDVDEDERRGCRGRATYPRGGNTCHDKFASSYSGVPREWEVTTPQGLSESFDARGQDRHTLYEMKTGYGWLGIKNPTPLQQRWINDTRERWQEQSATQQLVAALCGYDLVWVFSNRHAEEFASGLIEPPTRYVGFSCDEDGERRRR
jgi:hypothetical protein